jgi:hypothetical protein
MNGHHKHGMSTAAAIRTALSLLIYETPSLADGRDQAAEILAKSAREPLSTIRGKVAKFARTYDWSNPGGQDIHVPDKVRKTIEQVNKELGEDLCIEVRECQLKDVEDTPPTEVFPTQPPWELMKRIDLGEIVTIYPMHSLVKWAGDNKLRIFAIEAAFANVPQSLHKSPKVVEVAENLESYFKRWEKNR